MATVARVAGKMFDGNDDFEAETDGSVDGHHHGDARERW